MSDSITKYHEKEPFIEGSEYPSSGWRAICSGDCGNSGCSCKIKPFNSPSLTTPMTDFTYPSFEEARKDLEKAIKEAKKNIKTPSHCDNSERHEIFEQCIDETLESIRDLLLVKGKEYRRNNNPYHNFDEGARREGVIREKVLHGFRLKHEISVSDIRNDIEKGILPKEEKVNEKYNDILLYYLIEKASVLERVKTR